MNFDLIEVLCIVNSIFSIQQSFNFVVTIKGGYKNWEKIKNVEKFFF